MEKLTPREKAWISQLESSTPSVIMTAIREIQNHGNIRMLPYLFKLMQPATHEIIRKGIIMLLSEIKVQEAASIIVGELKHNKLGNDFAPLVAACWQSGLNFSEHIPAFIEIFVTGDYQTAIEAFSVIEESIINASPNMQKKCIQLMDNVSGKISEDKYLLFKELVKVVSATY